MDARRRRVDPPAPGRPHRRAAAAMGARVEAREGRFPPFTVPARACAGSSTSCRSPARRSSRACCSPGCSPTARRRSSSRRPAATTPSACCARAGVRVDARRRRVTVVQPRRARARRRSTSPATRPRPRSSSPPACSSPARGSCSRTSASTGRAPASCASSSAWAASSSATSRSPGDGDRRRRAGQRPRRRARAAVGTVVEADEVPLAIDELPLVALLGCFAEGETVVRGAQELRRQGVRPDRHRRRGPARPRRRHRGDRGRLRGPRHRRPARRPIDSHGDHRLAMLGAVAGLASREGVEVVGMEAAAVSYPGFADDLARLLRSSA